MIFDYQNLAIPKPAPRQKKPPKRIKRGPFKRHGKKTARKVAQLNAWIVEKERAWAECQGRCIARIAGCAGRATEPHHLRKRSLGGNTNPKCAWVCERCHKWIEANPAKAMKLGLYESHKAVA